MTAVRFSRKIERTYTMAGSDDTHGANSRLKSKVSIIQSRSGHWNVTLLWFSSITRLCRNSCIKVLYYARYYAPKSRCLEASISLTLTTLEFAHCRLQDAEIQSLQAQDACTTGLQADDKACIIAFMSRAQLQHVSTYVNMHDICPTSYCITIPANGHWSYDQDPCRSKNCAAQKRVSSYTHVCSCVEKFSGKPNAWLV